MACQYSPDDQTVRLQTGAGEDDFISLPSGPDRVACERQEEEEEEEEEEDPCWIISTHRHRQGRGSRRRCSPERRSQLLPFKGSKLNRLSPLSVSNPCLSQNP